MQISADPNFPRPEGVNANLQGKALQKPRTAVIMSMPLSSDAAKIVAAQVNTLAEISCHTTNSLNKLHDPL
jgi:hypothetical protein